MNQPVKKLFLLDAYALIYRAFFAFSKNPAINSKGLNTSAIMGFCNTLHEVLSKEKPDFIAVAFDPHGPTFRSEAFPEYKAQREKTPEDISSIEKKLLNLINQIDILERQRSELKEQMDTIKNEEERLIKEVKEIDTFMNIQQEEIEKLKVNN